MTAVRSRGEIGGSGGRASKARGIHVLVTITVPPNVPIDADTPEQETRATSIIDSARISGGRRVTGHWEKVRPGQAGRRIVEEAREIRARAVVMSLPCALGHDPVYVMQQVGHRPEAGAARLRPGDAARRRGEGDSEGARGGRFLGTIGHNSAFRAVGRASEPTGAREETPP
jgi:hypothetical protein